MSRVAKKPIVVPANVELTLGNGLVTVKGPKGCMTHKLNKLVSVKKAEENDKIIMFSPAGEDPHGWAQAGTARSLINNMVEGVTEGFSLTLELVGVGYRAQAKESMVVLSLGYSHPIEYKLPEGVNIETPNNTTIILKSVDNQLLGKVASDIRAFRPPEPYKGKGVKFAGEKIARKDAKKK